MILVPFCLLGAFLGPMAILGWQAYTWLKFGFWPSLPLFAVTDALGIGRPRANWVGLQQVIEYIYGWPFSCVLFLSFIALGLLLTTVDQAPKPPRSAPSSPT
jgi:hypothetical protein